MNQLIIKDIKITSLDIAEITGKEHKNIMRDIRNEIESLGEFNGLIFERVDYTDAKGEKRPCYQFGRKGAMQLALKYDAKTRYRVIERIEELEGKANYRIPQTLHEALRLAADLEEERQKLLPKAEYFDALVDRNLLTNFRDTAKELKIKEQSFIQWLINKNYIYRDQKKKLKPYSDHVPTLFEVKEFQNGKWASIQTLITPKGRETFRLLLERVTM